jgi:hypothetical protein
MGLTFAPSGSVTSPVSKDPPGKDDERVLDCAEIAVPARRRIEYVAKSRC